MSATVHSVREVTQALRLLLEDALPPLWVEGEISNFRESGNGHWYFTLKDAYAQIPCVMWKNSVIRQGTRPSDGLKARVYGLVTIYPQGGNYQIQATQLHPIGQGTLQLAFEQLRDRLREEGLFDESRKRQLPKFPKRIGVITSARGAAIRDILNVLARRYPVAPVTLFPVSVQGADSPREIVRALSLANHLATVDVLILGRGGGASEDLSVFNDQRVVRAIADSTIPIISAVGHEVDFTLSDFAADVRAPTPSAAAELAAPDCETLAREVNAFSERLYEGVRTRLRLARQELQRLEGALSPRRQLADVRLRSQELDELTRRLEGAMRDRLERQSNQLAAAALSLNALSPLATLERGYAICFDENRQVVRDAAAVEEGNAVSVRLHRGELDCVVVRKTE